MDNRVSRRGFVGAALVSAAAAASGGGPLPVRVLGRTGQKVTLLAFGCGSRLSQYKDDDKAVAAINLAIDSGVHYLDTAQSYGNGSSERRVGKVMATRRKEVFLATKVTVRGYDDALRAVDKSLERLQTSQLDLIHIHSLKFEDDLAAAEAGLLKALYHLRDQKITRFIGVTSHVDPKTLALALDRHDFDCTQMALNAALQGRSIEGKNLPPVPSNCFERIALPVAVRKNLGVIAMKVTAQDALIGSGTGKAGIQDLLRYTLSLPVTTASVGMPDPEHIKQNTELARSFQPMDRHDMDALSRRMSEANKLAIDHRFAGHQDL